MYEIFQSLNFDITSLFILCNVLYVQYFTSFYLEVNDLSNQHMYELFKKASFLACFVYLILPQKLLYLTGNKKLKFLNTWQCYIVFKKRH
jgi:hypothetical protein